MAGKPKKSAKTKALETPPFETRELRQALKRFFAAPFDTNALNGKNRSIGGFKWGVYVFYDYDGEPIYVGQTKEKVSGRIGRHLTNQRTDAVAMSVLDPFEVHDIEVFPLPEYEGVGKKHQDFARAAEHLNALEFAVHQMAKQKSKFNAILNEKDPPRPAQEVEVPRSFRGAIVSAQVRELRGHPDTRIARRAQVIARLSQTIAERDVAHGLRRALVTQSKRILNLAEDRYVTLGGAGNVDVSPEGADEEKRSAG